MSTSHRWATLVLRMNVALGVVVCLSFLSVSSGLRLVEPAKGPGTPMNDARDFSELSMDELQLLCSSHGLVRACEAAATLSSKPANMHHRQAQGPQGKKSVRQRCLPAGKLIFQHVMKTGGNSVDAFLKCSCKDLQVTQSDSSPFGISSLRNVSSQIDMLQLAAFRWLGCEVRDWSCFCGASEPRSAEPSPAPDIICSAR